MDTVAAPLPRHNGFETVMQACARGSLRSLCSLDLESNTIADPGMIAFSNAIRNGSMGALTHLYLDSNHIGNSGMIDFSRAIASVSLLTLTPLFLHCHHSLISLSTTKNTRNSRLLAIRVTSTYGDDTVSMVHTPGVTNVCDRGWQLERGELRLAECPVPNVGDRGWQVEGGGPRVAECTVPDVHDRGQQVEGGELRAVKYSVSNVHWSNCCMTVYRIVSLGFTIEL